MPVEIDPAALYVKAGVRSFGKGVFSYEASPGAEIGKLKFFELEPDRLVVSNIKAWEGAVAVTHQPEAGRVVSNRFLTYSSDSVSLQYLRHWLLSAVGNHALQAASPGSADRNRTLAASRFEAIWVPLPPRPEQDRIADHLDILSARITKAKWTSPSDPVLARLPHLIGDLLRSLDLPLVAVGDLAANKQEIIHPGDDLLGAEAFIGLEHVESHTGRASQGRPIDSEKGRKLLFRSGQVTYGYLRPYLNKAWVAESVGLCSVEQFVLQPTHNVDPRLLSLVLRSDFTWNAAKTATNGLQLPRLSLKKLLAFSVPDIRGIAEPESVVALAERMTDLASRIDARRSDRLALADAILPAARNEIFNSML